MQSVCFELSGRGVGDASVLDEKNFVFVVGGVEYQCCRFQACFISGLVRRLIASDRCVSRVSLQVCDDERHFKDVVSLMNGQKISITPANASFLEACARELDNDELLGGIIDFRLDDDLSISNVVDRIRIKHELHKEFQEELDFLALHFFEMASDSLNKLSSSDLELVLANPLLTLASEDRLYDTIVSLADEKGDDFLILLRNVQFGYLSQSKLEEFLDRVFPNLVDASLWCGLCELVRRFCASDGAKASLEKGERYNIKTFKGDKGIMQHLRSECGGNPAQEGVISMSATRRCYNQCYQVLDYGWNDYWYSGSEPNAFIRFDFKTKRVCLGSYRLLFEKTWSNASYALVSWVLEVSDDGKTWEVVDKQNRDRDRGVVGRGFSIPQNDRFVRFVQLRQTGKNRSGYDHLMLSEIEFFGQLKETSSPR